jgi:formate--tetrahydrofolate ligase
MSLRPIEAVAEELGLASDHVLPHGRDKAKVELDALRAPTGKLVLVSAITPTRAGEGKTTVSLGLSMGLRRIGVRAVPCLREPSLGPVFGIKGGGTGGGRATVEPADAINLHFTGDLHAVGAAHNLLAALMDNALHFGEDHGLDPRRISWPRVLDVNDRALRHVLLGLDGHGVPRESRFDITAASEVMAALCLAEDLPDLRTRLARVVVGQDRAHRFVTAGDLGAADAMTALLVDALKPNLAQTAEGGPAIVHGGPFANIAHGCSSVLGTRLGLSYADVVVTEAGFGFDLGGEKFLDIKCRSAGLSPDLVVMVATLRALKVHGGAPVSRAAEPDAAALRAGLSNLEAHLDAVDGFGLPALVALNRFAEDTDEELALVEAWCAERGVGVAPCDGFARGGQGATALAERVMGALANEGGAEPRFPYPLEARYADKLEAIATRVYGADGVILAGRARRAFERFESAGHGGLPVCVAKTFQSIADDPKKLGRPRDFTVTVREARLSAGAGYVVALLGDVMTMPGLPRRPAAQAVRVDPDGAIRGLMQNDDGS